ncbi:MAG: RAMP superfamily CRISPR-associated protein [Thermoplasmatales archaeon]|nr:RAMP superfamily CRISPR-associated protein [Candidatus Methanoperedenaceae archaeon]MCG2827309.1 RAMP superfamily CRISPR-associated protein [Thermoplasmatales archaeon]
MTYLNFRLELLSDTLIGSGEGWGANIDSDIVFDDLGLPYIPGKRVKGCLRESAVEVVEMFEVFEKSGIRLASIADVDTMFGKPGQSCSSILSFSNCYLKDYDSNREWLEWLTKKYQGLFSKEMILSTFSTTRQQTAIDNNGIAKDHSLRTKRVLKKGFVFFGRIEPSTKLDDRLLGYLVYVIRNLRYVGTNRNRGLGFVKCGLLNERGESLEKKYLDNLRIKIKEC